jgi:hypothetical protein
MNLKHARDTITTLVAPAARQGGTTHAPSGGVRLARGLDTPSGELHLARGGNTPSGGVRLARGLNAPSGGVRLARGLNTPLGGVRLARGLLHARRPRSCPHVQAFNALAPQDTCHDPDTPGNRVPALLDQLLWGGYPCRCFALCDEAGVSPVTLRRLPPYG